MLLVLLTFSVQGSAQNVKVPAWEKFVQINKEGVNLRKAPNAQSAKLMVRTYEADFMYVSELSWAAGAGKTPFHLEADAVVPVIEETGDWYRIYIYGYNGVRSNILDAYIRRDFCATVEPCMLNTANENSQEGWTDNGQAYKVAGSNDLYVAYQENEIDGYDACIGKSFGVGVVWLYYEGFFEYLKSISGNDYGGINMDMSKITEARVKQFMRSHQSSSPSSISYCFNSKNYTFNFNQTEYPFRITSQTETYTIQKFVVSATGQELQIQQAPGQNAAKLIFVKEEPSNPYWFGYLDWDYNLIESVKVTPATSSTYAVVGEEGDWYKVLGCYNYWLGDQLYTAIGYIQKSAVTDAAVKPITEAILRGNSHTVNGNDKDGRARIFNIPNSDDVVISWGYPRVGTGAVSVANIGRIHNGVALMYDNAFYNFNERDKNVIIGNSTFAGNRLGTLVDGSYWEVDFTKLTNDDVLKLLRENGEGSYAFAFVNINDQYLHIVTLGCVNARKIVFPAAQ